MADVESGLVPKRQNDEGEAICHVRWMVETPSSWIGAWDRQAFDAYVSAAVSAERERWTDVVAHAASGLEELDDETAQCQAEALRWLLPPNAP